jgi:chromosome partitioning protein
MGTTYAVVNQKGGVGKTTTAVNVGAYLALSGAKTLLVDADPQSNATSGLGVDRRTLTSSTYSVLVDNAPAAGAIVDTPVQGLRLLPANMDLAGADIELMPRISRETVLRRALDPIREDYDVVIIDAPPSLGLLTLNALVAADAVLLPVQTEYYALEGLSQLLQTIDLVKAHLNPSLEIARVILTLYDFRTRLARQVVDEIRGHFKEQVARTIIPRNVRLSEAPSHGLPIALYDPKSQGAAAYKAVAEEVLHDAKTRAGKRSGGADTGKPAGER